MKSTYKSSAGTGWQESLESSLAYLANFVFRLHGDTANVEPLAAIGTPSVVSQASVDIRTSLGVGNPFQRQAALAVRRSIK